jgi:hypothetical protein
MAYFATGNRTAALLQETVLKVQVDKRTPLERLDDRIAELERRVAYLKVVRDNVREGVVLKEAAFCVNCMGEGCADQVCPGCY